MIAGAGAIRYIRKSSDQFDKNAQAVMTVIDRFKQLNDLDSFDVVLTNPNEVSSRYRSEMKRFDSESKAVESVIGREVKKGYDLIHVRVKDGFFTPFHMHRNSEEFVYVLRGSLNVFFCEEEMINDECEDKVETSGIISGIRDIVELKSGDYIMLKNNESHSVSSSEESEFIIVALPPLEKVLIKE